MIRFFKYIQSSMASGFIDLLSFYAFLLLLGWHPLSMNWNVIFISTVMARVLSSAFNFVFNRNYVFGQKEKDVRVAAVKYYTLCGASMALSGLLVSVSSYALLVGSARIVTIIKVAVDSALFFMNYHIQRKWVFK